MNILSGIHNLGYLTMSRFGVCAWVQSTCYFQVASGVCVPNRSISWSQTGTGTSSHYLSWSGSRSKPRTRSEVETNKSLIFRNQEINLKITNISALNPKILISKQRQVGFELKTNQLEVGQQLKWEFAQVIKPGVPIFMLKEVGITTEFWRKKMNFCLIRENAWLVFA